MEIKVQDKLLLTKGILKALFTTAPTHATQVIVQDNGKLVIRDVPKSRPAAETFRL